MEFQVKCSCGNSSIVTEGSAGAIIQCACGRRTTVPPLKDLRLSAGLPAYDPSPELVIEHLLKTGGLRAGSACVECGIDTADRVTVTVECEKPLVRRSGGFAWPLLLLSMLALPVHVLLWEKRQLRVFGKEKSYMLPLTICRQCRTKSPREPAIKKWLCSNPDYARLLDKFPDAKVRLVSV
jgi:hypothetical protein